MKINLIHVTLYYLNDLKKKIKIFQIFLNIATHKKKENKNKKNNM